MEGPAAVATEDQAQKDALIAYLREELHEKNKAIAVLEQKVASLESESRAEIDELKGRIKALETEQAQQSASEVEDGGMLAVAMIRQLQLEGTDALGTENLLNPTSSSFSPTAATATTTTTPPHLSRQRIAEMAATAMESSTSTGSSNSMTPPLHRPLDGPPLTLAPPPLLNPKRDRPKFDAPCFYYQQGRPCKNKNCRFSHGNNVNNSGVIGSRNHHAQHHHLHYQPQPSLLHHHHHHHAQQQQYGGHHHHHGHHGHHVLMAPAATHLVNNHYPC